MVRFSTSVVSTGTLYTFFSFSSVLSSLQALKAATKNIKAIIICLFKSLFCFSNSFIKSDTD